MKSSTRLIALVVAMVLMVPALAFAQSLSVRKSASQGAVYSASSAKYYKSNQGSVEEGGVAGMFSTIYSRTSSTGSWTTRKTVLAAPGGSNSSSVGSNGTLYYWRLGLSGPLSAGYGVLNAFN